MKNDEDSLDSDENLEKMDGDAEPTGKKISKQKLLLIIVPVLVVIAVVLGFVSARTQKFEEPKYVPYSVIENDNNGVQSVLVLYDLPEITAKIAGKNKENIKLKLNLELTNVDDVKPVETLLPKIIDSVIFHLAELKPEEMEGVSSLYWLKEELLHRINLITAPVKVANLNFKQFELQAVE